MSAITVDGAEIPVRERAGPSGVEYEFALPDPVTNEPVTVIARIAIDQHGVRPVVHVRDAPDCRRHRYPQDHSLCLWFEPDDETRKWTVTDGLDQLAVHVKRHLFQEAVCRAGDSWPGEESPGEHPRPRSCATCGGVGT